MLLDEVNVEQLQNMLQRCKLAFINTAGETLDDSEKEISVIYFDEKNEMHILNSGVKVNPNKEFVHLSTPVKVGDKEIIYLKKSTVYRAQRKINISFDTSVNKPVQTERGLVYETEFHNVIFPIMNISPKEFYNTMKGE